MTTVTAGHRLATVYRELDDCREKLGVWWETDSVELNAAALHSATEALLRAVATLTLVVEGEGER